MKNKTCPHYKVKKNGHMVKPQFISKYHIKYYDKDNLGINRMEVYETFPGIQLIYKDFSTNYCNYELDVSGKLLEINYCHEGREECQWICGHYLYLGAGDLSITQMENNSPPLCFPTKFYRGISIILDLDILKEIPPPLLEHSELDLEHFSEKFCPGHHFFAIRANEQVAHIFEELYQVPTAVKEDYLKIKVLELLLFLRLINPKEEQQLKQIPQSQIDLIHNIQSYLTTNLQRNITIEQLAKEFCISTTSLKTYFKSVHNTTIKEFVRKERMKRAAQLLREGDKSVSDIALQLGYKNRSKFASAFKTVYGLTPLEYRKKV